MKPIKPTVLSVMCALALVGCWLAQSEGVGAPLPDRQPSAEAPSSEEAGRAEGTGSRPDGAERLTDPPPGISDQNAAFSPDGATILFTRWRGGYNEGPSGIYLLGLDSGQITPLSVTDDNDTVNMPGTSWNAATGLIAFASDRSDYEEVWFIAPDGSHLTQVTEHASDEHWIEPTWSPDGAWMVFEINRALHGKNVPSGLWIVRTDGSELRPLVDDPAFDDRQPNWSPVDDRIVFQRREPGDEDWQLYTVRADGSDLRQVTDAPSGDTDASWSPDGAWIVYSSDYGGLDGANLFIIPAEDGEPTRVTFNAGGYDGAPTWSPDGAWIAFESQSGGEDAPTSIWRIAAPPRE